MSHPPPAVSSGSPARPSDAGRRAGFVALAVVITVFGFGLMLTALLVFAFGAPINPLVALAVTAVAAPVLIGALVWGVTFSRRRMLRGERSWWVMALVCLGLAVGWILAYVVMIQLAG